MLTPQWERASLRMFRPVAVYRRERCNGSGTTRFQLQKSGTVYRKISETAQSGNFQTQT